MSHSENDEANENECDKVPLLTINNDADSDTIPEILVASNKTSETDIHTNLLSKRLSGPNHQQKTYRKNRRIDHSRRSRSDKWGRIRLGVLSLGFLFIIYFGFLFGTEDSIRSPTILVNVPPQDESLPGPKGNDSLQSTFILYFPFAFVFAHMQFYFGLFTSNCVLFRSHVNNLSVLLILYFRFDYFH